MLRRLKLTQRLSLLLVIFAAGFFVYGLWSFKTLDKIRVGGAIYQRIAQNEALISDVLPPPLYIIESYLVCLQITSSIDNTHAGALIDQLRVLEAGYRERTEFWRNARLGGELDHVLFDLAHPKAAAFYYTAFNEFLPAFHLHDPRGVARALASMTRLYDEHRIAIDQVVVLAKARGSSEERAATAEIEKDWRYQLALLMATGSLAIVVTALVRRSIAKPLAEAVGIAKAVANGQLDIQNTETYADEPGQLLSALREMSDCLRTSMSAMASSEATAREAKQMAEVANQSKSDFLANMSHEIRTPMNAIIGMTGLVLRTDLNARQRNYLEKINAAAAGLLGIIGDILDFSKIEAGKLSFERRDFSLQHALDHLATLSSLKVHDKGLELLFDVAPNVPDRLTGDELRLGQVLLNLVNNAIKFTRDGEVRVNVRCLQRGADEAFLQFEVRDTGIGITLEHRARLFAAFEQADSSTTREYGGTGLGLTISSRLVEMMGGSLSVVSQPGAGSCFTFTARFGAPPRELVPVRGRAAVPDPRLAGLRLLVVDDNPGARDIMASLLASLALQATVVDSGRAAIDALLLARREGRAYGVLLVDWLMPGMDGLEALRHIRAHERADKGVPATPVVVMVTAASRDDLIEHAGGAGGAGGVRLDAVLEKPVSPASVLDALCRALGRTAQSAALAPHRRESYEALVARARGLRVLLVEDNEINQELATDILCEAGVQVDLACDGAQAVSMVQRAAYDAVLMDWQMPVMDGVEATRRIRAMPAFAALPILAMTANAMAGDREHCLAAGMNDHIAKPIVVEELLRVLLQWAGPPHLAPTGAGLPQAMHPQEQPVPLPADAARGYAALEGVNVAAALRRLRGDGTRYGRLLHSFAASQAQVVPALRLHLARGERTTAERLAHTLRGLAANLGAERLEAVARALEQALRQGDDDRLAASLDEAGTCMATLLRAIAALPAPGAVLGAVAVADDTAAATEAASPAQTGLQLRQLADLLRDDDSRASTLAELLAASPQFRADTQGLGKVLRHVQDYDFDQALAALTEVCQRLGIALPAANGNDPH